MTRLFHVSEDHAIKLFTPRPPLNPKVGVIGNAVWAIDYEHLPHYLVPSDCPRITLRRGPQTNAEDIDRFFSGGVEKLIAIEMGWYERVKSARLFIYELPAAPFTPVETAAGYYVSREPVTPTSVVEVTDVIERMLQYGYKLRLLPNLWPLNQKAVKSSVQFSMIRMRNALPKGA